MTILDDLLSELRKTKGPILSSEVAAKVGVTNEVLAGMISVLVAKGKLMGAEPQSIDEVFACSGGACGSTCVGLEECPFIVDVPDSYALMVGSVDGTSTREP